MSKVLPPTFLDIARRIHIRFYDVMGISPPRVTLAFDTATDALNAWHSILDEFPEQSLYPTKREYPEQGRACIHGVVFEIVPMPPFRPLPATGDQE